MQKTGFTSTDTSKKKKKKENRTSKSSHKKGYAFKHAVPVAQTCQYQDKVQISMHQSWDHLLENDGLHNGYGKLGTHYC